MAEHDRQERTDRLENTIQAIERLQQTGVLNLERAKGGVRETARIVFFNGQVVEVMAGSRTARDAFDWVLAWGSCRYTFDVSFATEMAVPQPSSPPVEEESPSPSRSPLAFFSHMVQKYTHSLSDTAQTAEETASTEPVEELPTAPFPQLQIPFSAVYPLTPIPPTVGPQSATMRSRVPFRLVNDHEAVSYMERLGLSRLHRHVFFLLDGQRTAFDIVRLTGRSFYEIQNLFAELEQLGLIRTEHVSVGEAINEM